MHPESYAFMSRLSAAYCRPGDSVLDVGGADVGGGTYRPLFRQGSYTTLDMDESADVRVHGHEWPLGDECCDVVISGQAFEHDKFFWLTMKNIGRVLRPGGVAILIAPSRGRYHAYPKDYWRFYPDSMSALAEWAALDLIEVQYTASAMWKDIVGIMRKPRAASASKVLVTGLGGSGTRYLSRILHGAGLPVAHEKAFTQERGPQWLKGQKIEVSSLAVPNLEAITGTTKIVQLVRSLTQWLPSYAQGIERADERRARFLNELLPGVTKKTPAEAAVRLWTAVNRRIARCAQMLVRVEHIDARSVVEIAKLAGCEVDPERVRQTISRTDRTIGTRRRGDAKRCWSLADVAHGEDRRQAIGLAEWYGYSFSGVG